MRLLIYALIMGLFTLFIGGSVFLGIYLLVSAARTIRSWPKHNSAWLVHHPESTRTAKWLSTGVLVGLGVYCAVTLIQRGEAPLPIVAIPSLSFAVTCGATAIVIRHQSRNVLRQDQ